jgi:hypothetical protein
MHGSDAYTSRMKDKRLNYIALRLSVGFGRGADNARALAEPTWAVAFLAQHKKQKYQLVISPYLSN